MADAKIARLAQISLFSRCNEAQLEHLAQISDEVTVGAGHHIVQQGHGVHHCYVVMDGSARVTIDDEEVGQADPGEVLGEISMFDQGPASATVTANDTMELLVIDHRQFLDALATVPGLSIAMLYEMANRVREIGAHL